MLKNLKSFDLPEIEGKVLEFWQKNQIFEKSLKQRAKSPVYSFFDGPPFANGLPHYGHILATVIKDTATRFWTMVGYKVERRVGWDCHGLPVENEVEKELGIKSKKEIEEKFGIKQFNAACRASVFRYKKEWEGTLKRVGRWADYNNAYATMDNDYIESVWWVFKQLWDKKLVYKDYRVTAYCPRCGTSLSNFEVNQSYKDVYDPSIYVKFPIEGEKNTYFLVWTTTPWTLPANLVLAIHRKIPYIKIKINDEYLILAKEKLDIIKDSHKIEGEVIGRDIRNLLPFYKNKAEAISYRQIFDFVRPTRKLFIVCYADFVSADEGTGIIHIAPTYGTEDMELAKKLGFNNYAIHCIDKEGKFLPDFKPWAGKFVKDADSEIIQELKSRNLLFKSNKIKHSYPFCWRCETPLLYMARDSWYIRVTALRKQLVANNKKIHWVPKHIREGRFGKWLEQARDWDFSRSRYWGAPLPLWQCQKCESYISVGSLKELARLASVSGNKYFILRHGEAESNTKNIANTSIKNNHYHLTDKGRKQAAAAADKIKKEKIDLIFTSDFARTRETAEIVAERIGLEKKKIIFDKRLREVNIGIFEGKNVAEYRRFATIEEKFSKAPAGGENLTELKNRVSEFLYEIDGKHSNKKILIVSHEYPIWLLAAGAAGADAGKAIGLRENKDDFVKFAEIKNLDFVPLPHNQNFELDFHKPYIDEIKFNCLCGGKISRVLEVFDCWFESGSMPYAQDHYPFAFAQNQKSKIKNKKFPVPADFIAEGLDQTRGWFYTLHVLATALFNKPAFKNVVVNGLILDGFGQKLSKKLRNYTEPQIIIEKYGADALRYFLLSSTSIGEDYRFSDKGVEEIKRKVVDRLMNSYNFFDLYANKNISINQINQHKSASILDKWILARLNEAISKITKKMKEYELTDASRLLINFIDDLSNWYIRRSRRRFQRPDNRKDFEQASAVLNHILLETSKLIAPFAPFVAEVLYQQFGNSLRQSVLMSVHLENWPITSKAQITNHKSQKLLKGMEDIRQIASLVLAKRAEAQIKVRQPLQKLKIRNSKLKINEELLEILKDEINVKEIIFDAKIKDEIELDTKITPELRKEGILREFIRMAQGLRQKAGYKPQDKIQLFVESGDEVRKILNKHLATFKKEVGAKIIKFRRVDKFDAEEETRIGGQKIWLGIKKVK